MEGRKIQRADAASYHVAQQGAGIAGLYVVKHQLRRLGKGKGSNPGVSPVRAFLEQQIETTIKTRRYRSWMRRQPA